MIRVSQKNVKIRDEDTETVSESQSIRSDHHGNRKSDLSSVTQNRRLKPAKPVKTEKERMDQAKYEIYQFYSRQHVKRDIGFDEQQEVLKINKGEILAFCRDFNIKLPKSKIQEAFVNVSPYTSVDFEQFNKFLPLIALEYASLKVRETKFRLRELKYVLEYPGNSLYV